MEASVPLWSASCCPAICTAECFPLALCPASQRHLETSALCCSSSAGMTWSRSTRTSRSQSMRRSWARNPLTWWVNHTQTHCTDARMWFDWLTDVSLFSDWLQGAHLAVIDSLMSLSAMEIVGQVKMTKETDQFGSNRSWENSLLFWINKVHSWSSI